MSICRRPLKCWKSTFYPQRFPVCSLQRMLFVLRLCWLELIWLVCGAHMATVLHQYPLTGLTLCWASLHPVQLSDSDCRTDVCLVCPRPAAQTAVCRSREHLSKTAGRRCGTPELWEPLTNSVWMNWALSLLTSSCQSNRLPAPLTEKQNSQNNGPIMVCGYWLV